MKKIIFVLIALLFIIPIFAAGGSLIGSSCNVNSDSIKAKEECSQETKYNSWANVISDSCNFVMDSVKSSITGYKGLDEPDSQLSGIKNQIAGISFAFVVFALTAAGFMYISSSSDPRRRTKAKAMLMSAMYMMIFVGAAHYISALLFDAGFEAATLIETNIEGFQNQDPWKELISSPPDTDVDEDNDDVADAYARFSSIVSVAPLFILSGWGYILVMYLRNIIVTLLTVVAPLIVVLFFFHPTRAFGITLFSLYGVELFIPVFLFPVFKVADVLMSVAGTTATVKIVIMAAALAASVVLHILLAGVAVAKASAWRGDQ